VTHAAAADDVAVAPRFSAPSSLLLHIHHWTSHVMLFVFRFRFIFLPSFFAACSMFDTLCSLQGTALLSCNAKREEAEGQLRAAAVAESKLKRDVLVLKDEKKAVVARVSQLEAEISDAMSALAAARAGEQHSA
jgi:hypothetical protein